MAKKINISLNANILNKYLPQDYLTDEKKKKLAYDKINGVVNDNTYWGQKFGKKYMRQ